MPQLYFEFQLILQECLCVSKDGCILYTFLIKFYIEFLECTSYPRSSDWIQPESFSYHSFRLIHTKLHILFHPHYLTSALLINQEIDLFIPRTNFLGHSLLFSFIFFSILLKIEQFWTSPIFHQWILVIFLILYFPSFLVFRLYWMAKVHMPEI